MGLAGRLEKFRESLGLTQDQMAEALGISLRTYSRYVSGGGAPNLAQLEHLIGLGCAIAWLLTGVGVDGQSQSQSFAPTDAIEIECLAFRASAGNGALVVDSTGGKATIRREVLERLNLRPEHARLLHADGDSMLPTIHHGDPLIIDVSPAARASAIDNKVYVFTIGEEAYVKRLRREPGRLVMISDNRENFPERPVPEGEPFRIVGRVKWGEREL